jgi:hypothetical protein
MSPGSLAGRGSPHDDSARGTCRQPPLGQGKDDNVVIGWGGLGWGGWGGGEGLVNMR